MSGEFSCSMAVDSTFVGMIKSNGIFKRITFWHCGFTWWFNRAILLRCRHSRCSSAVLSDRMKMLFTLMISGTRYSRVFPATAMICGTSLGRSSVPVPSVVPSKPLTTIDKRVAFTFRTIELRLGATGGAGGAGRWFLRWRCCASH